MFYIKSLDNGMYAVHDTSDGVTEEYTKGTLLRIAENGIDIDGVSVHEGLICVVVPAEETERQLQKGLVHLALSKMTLSNQSFGIRFKSRPTSGELKFASHEVINISRRGVNDFCMDRGNSKSYRSGLTLDDVLMNFPSSDSWSIESVKLGRY